MEEAVGRAGAEFSGAAVGVNIGKHACGAGPLACGAGIVVGAAGGKLFGGVIADFFFGPLRHPRWNTPALTTGIWPT